MLALAAVLLVAQIPGQLLGQFPPPPAAGVADRPEAAAAGPRRYQVERIAILGLARTREAQVRRHLAVAEGDVLDDAAVLISRLKLLQLGWFSRVETRVERGSQRGLVLLVFAVTERHTLLVSDLVVGSTHVQPIYGGFGLSQQNFLGRGFGWPPARVPPDFLRAPTPREGTGFANHRIS